MSEHRHEHGSKKHRQGSKAGHGGHDHAHNHADDHRHVVRVKAKDTPGVICLERHTHDDAIVISGSLTVDYENIDIGSLVARELENAAVEIGERGGIIGHIKTALTVSSTSMISVTDVKAMEKEAPQKRAKITLAAIVFMLTPEIAEDIIRKSMVAVRTNARKTGE